MKLIKPHKNKIKTEYQRKKTLTKILTTSKSIRTTLTKIITTPKTII